MGLFDDADRGQLDFEEGSETSSSVDEREEQPGPAGQATPVTGNAFQHIDMSTLAPRKYIYAYRFFLNLTYYQS